MSIYRNLTVLIGANVTHDAGSINNLEARELIVLGQDMAEVDTSPTVAEDPHIYVVQGGTNNDRVFSPKITNGQISRFDLEAWSTSTQQVGHVGYNGTSGSLSTTANSEHQLTVVLDSNQNLYSQRPHWRRYNVTSDGTANEVDVAHAILELWDSDVEAKKYLTMELLSNDGGAAIGAAADTVVGTAGSTSLVVTDTGADSSVNVIAAGDYIRVGTATTDAIYKVKTGIPVTGGTIELETALIADVNLVGNTAEYITAALANAGAAGLQITGVAQPEETLLPAGPFVRFNLMTDGELYGSTLNSSTTDPDPGSGNYWQVAQMERMALGNRGITNWTGHPADANRAPLYAVSGTDYDCVVIECYDKHHSGNLDKMTSDRYQIHIYFPTGGIGQACNDYLDTYLDQWMVDAGFATQIP